MLLFHAGDPCSGQDGMVITGIIQVNDELFHFGVSSMHLVKQTNHLLGVQVFFGNPDIKVFMIFRADCPQDVQSFASASHTDMKSLAPHKPAAMHQFNAPHRMRAIQEIASGGIALRFLPPITAQIFFVFQDRL